MNDRKAAPCGSWKSPITAEQIVNGEVSFQEIVLDGDTLYWVESRPSEEGRYVVVRANTDGSLIDITPQPYNARSIMYSYGGGSFAVANGTVFFSNFVNGPGEMPYARYNDQRLFRQDPGQQPFPLTDTLGSCYADGVIDVSRNALITVRGDQTFSLHGQAMNSIVSVSLSGAAPQKILVQGNDFYTTPRLSPDGKQLCWLTWNYPSMPWDGTQLWLADMSEDGSLSNARLIAGGTEESIFQPEWSPDGTLYFISDRTNWWNLYRFTAGGVEPVYLKPADFGAPQWNMRMSQYSFLSSDRIVCSHVEEGEWRLSVLDLQSSALKTIDTGFTEISHVRAGQNFVVFLAGSPTSPTALVKLNLDTGEKSILKSSTGLDIQSLQPYISQPTPISFKTEGNAISYAFYYPPENPDFSVPPDEKPPLIIKSHGGPTAAASTALDLSTQYFTSRGFGVVDVNYRGSTGYGRAYRLSLYGNWGLYDLQDCVSAAHYLIEKGEVDAQRIVARGGSAGGYTTLCLLAFTNLLKAGASYYGVSNLEMIAMKSDQLEAHYPDKLVGPYPSDKITYDARSPYYHADQVKSPAIFFQGLEDPVVPPEQTKVMVASLDQRGVPVAALYFPKEQHGFRIAADIQQSLEAEFYFYSQILHFHPADDLAPIEIKNWPS